MGSTKAQAATDAAKMLARLKKSALQDVESAAGDLSHALTVITKSAVASLDALAAGMGPFGLRSGGPLGHQATFDVAVASVKLQAAADKALWGGARAEEITEAIKKGAEK